MLEDFRERLQELAQPVQAAAAVAAFNDSMAYAPLGLEDFQERLHELVAPAV
jgi:hypothetical protein